LDVLRTTRPKVYPTELISWLAVNEAANREERKKEPQKRQPGQRSGFDYRIWIKRRQLFRCVCRAGNSWGNGMTEKVVWHVVKENAAKLGLLKVAPHDLRRSCARLCHAIGGELEQIQFLLGHVSVQTTERYLGCKQRLKGAVNDLIGIEPEK
jgi:hypothetical protein